MADPVHPKSLSLTGRLWEWPELLPSSTQEAEGIPSWIGTILERRGIVGQEEIERYLSPSLSTLDDPMQMADMPAAASRLQEAIAHGDSITVYGDYDVDGVSSTTILVEFLTQVGARVDYYIPDRRSEGYGLNADAVRKLATETRLLVTVDCGITAHEELTLARELGLDVIVVDHHTVPDQLPPAVACLNPHRTDCDYPFVDLCAAGVAFMLAAATRSLMRNAGAFNDKPEPDLRDLLEIVALATVADMVPLTGTNRTLVAAGLRRMPTTKRVGLRALLKVSLADSRRITATDLAFRVGPRINARGRIAHAREAVELLLTTNASRAKTLAGALDTANRRRRELEKETVAAAIERVESEELQKRPALVLYDPSWHPGILGLVATRLTSRFHRPAIVVGEGGKGSGRSIEGLDLHAAIEGASQHLIRFGGHPAAAGITIEESKLSEFSEAFAGEVRQQIGEPPFVPVLRPDLEIEPQRLSLNMLSELSRLEPFGQKNPEPLLVARGLKVSSSRVVGERHLKLRLGNEEHEAIAFGFGEYAAEIPATVDVAFRLMRNDYRGRVSLQLKIEDLRPTS